jgi:iron complex transport system ATP-binding protein
MSELLRAQGIEFAYGAEPVLRGVDFALRSGELSILVGPNGSGKTTLARILCGTLAPRAGRVELCGAPLASRSRRDTARLLAVVPQRSHVVFPYRVREMVAMGRAPHLGALGREGPRDREQVAAALAALDLEALAERSYPTLSGGEQQRVLLARALAQDSDVWLFDEPTAHMDLGHRLHAFEWLRGWLTALPSRRGVLLITHDLQLAARFADRLTLLHAGRVLASGPPEEVLTAAYIALAYGVEARVERGPEGHLALEAVRYLGPSPLRSPGKDG